MCVGVGKGEEKAKEGKEGENGEEKVIPVKGK